jgi:hypothetical protein
VIDQASRCRADELGHRYRKGKLMKKNWIATATLLLIVGLSASAIATSNRAPISGKTTLKFTLQGVAGDNIDLGQPGSSLGDEFISSSLLLQHGSKVGRIDSVCVVTNSTPPTTVCQAGLRLDSGQIEVMGRVPGKALSGQADVKIAVVGGTGAYRHAHGVATVDTVNSVLTLVLTP